MKIYEVLLKWHFLFVISYEHKHMNTLVSLN